MHGACHRERDVASPIAVNQNGEWPSEKKKACGASPENPPPSNTEETSHPPNKTDVLQFVACFIATLKLELFVHWAERCKKPREKCNSSRKIRLPRLLLASQCDRHQSTMNRVSCFNLAECAGYRRDGALRFSRSDRNLGPWAPTPRQGGGLAP